jgi:hypothetical protein
MTHFETVAKPDRPLRVFELQMPRSDKPGPTKNFPGPPDSKKPKPAMPRDDKPGAPKDAPSGNKPGGGKR